MEKKWQRNFFLLKSNNPIYRWSVFFFKVCLCDWHPVARRHGVCISIHKICPFWTCAEKSGQVFVFTRRGLRDCVPMPFDYSVRACQLFNEINVGRENRTISVVVVIAAAAVAAHLMSVYDVHFRFKCHTFPLDKWNLDWKKKKMMKTYTRYLKVTTWRDPIIWRFSIGFICLRISLLVVGISLFLSFGQHFISRHQISVNHGIFPHPTQSFQK